MKFNLNTSQVAYCKVSSNKMTLKIHVRPDKMKHNHIQILVSNPTSAAPDPLQCVLADLICVSRLPITLS